MYKVSTMTVVYIIFCTYVSIWKNKNTHIIQSSIVKIKFVIIFIYYEAVNCHSSLTSFIIR